MLKSFKVFKSTTILNNKILCYNQIYNNRVKTSLATAFTLELNILSVVLICARKGFWSK